MSDTINFYPGADYGFEPKYDDEFLGMAYRAESGSVGLATDARTANQIQMTTEKLNTGAKAVEIQLTMPEVAESIPIQHFDELRRLKDLTGVDLTLHGSLVEPTGITRRGWDETQRVQSERQMWLSLERAHQLEPKGNIVVTFHSSNGLPETESVVIDEETGKEKITNVVLIDERTGDLAQVVPRIHKFPGQEGNVLAEIKKQNEENWLKELQHVNFNAFQGNDIVHSALSSKEVEDIEKSKGKEAAKQIYKLYSEGKKDEAMKILGPDFSQYEKILDEKMSRVAHGDIYLRDAYKDFKNLYEKAYDAAERSNSKDDLKKLDAFAKEIEPKIKALETDSSKVDELGDLIVKGVTVLKSVNTPQQLRPLREFAIDKASDTFSNLAVKSFKEFRDSAPVISIENPPAGMGLSRATELKELITESRNKFAEKAVAELGISKSEAEDQAKKLIGATWDLGHINMIKKFGFTDETLKEETRKIAPFVKNIHLSDNFGMEHTELPMGMGNVPTKAHMNILNEFAKKAKKIIETAQWYQHFKTTPFSETLSALGSPIYSMQLSPSWNQAYGRTSAGYFAGYGMNPDIHHSIYGSGFSSLPVELGGQMSGKSRLSGTPIE